MSGPAPTAEPLPGWRPLFSGKVRDVYAAEADPAVLLLVASDRVSAFDHVLEPAVPGKGRVLTALSRWWVASLPPGVPHHLVEGGAPPVPPAVAPRATVVRRLEMVPVECVARGYLTGSGWAEYRERGTLAGLPLPPGLRDGSALPEPVFTPATKAPAGQHDQNVTVAELRALVGPDLAADLERRTLAVYRRGHEVAARAGLVLADTKLEFGRDPSGGGLVLADEVLTPDSSRFWDEAAWQVGELIPYDKQVVRDWLLSPASGWSPASGEAPPPLPPHVVDATAARYREVLARLTAS